MGASTGLCSQPKTPGGGGGGGGGASEDASTSLQRPVDSSAFFIRNDANGDEILVFGDVEPDALSMLPRNQAVWDDAAARIARGTLRAIFIECSYDDSVRDQDLYGHLCPRHLVAELAVLAEKVQMRRNQEVAEEGNEESQMRSTRHGRIMAGMKQQKNGSELSMGAKDAEEMKPGLRTKDSSSGKRTVDKKRKRDDEVISTNAPGGASTTNGVSISVLDASIGNSHPHLHVDPATDTLTADGSTERSGARPLENLTIHIIHVKDPMTDDEEAAQSLATSTSTSEYPPSSGTGSQLGDRIQHQLIQASEKAKLGCRFHVTRDGGSIWI